MEGALNYTKYFNTDLRSETDPQYSTRKNGFLNYIRDAIGNDAKTKLQKYINHDIERRNSKIGLEFLHKIKRNNIFRNISTT